LAGIAGNWTSCLSVLEGHRAAVNAVAVDNEAQRIVSGSDDCTVRLWNGRTGVAIKGNRGTLLGHTKAVRAVAFSPDGKQIVSGSEDCMLRLWDAGTGKPIRQPFAGHTEWVNSVSFLPNGRSIISGSGDKSIRVWNPETGRETHPPLLGHQHWVNSVAVHSNGGQFVSGSEDNSVCLWDVEDMRLVWRPPILHTEGVNSVAFSAGGHLFVSASDSCVIVWDSQKTQALHELHHRRRGYAKAVAFSPFRNDIIYCFGKSIRVWDGITNHLPHAIYWGHNSGASCVTTSRDGEFIISGSRDNTLRIFSAGKAAEIPPDHADRITSLVVSPSRALVLSGSTDGCIQLREVAKGSHAPDRRHGKGGAILFVGFSPDGGRLLSASYVARAVPGEAPQKGGVIRLWDAKSGECIQNCRTSFLPDGFTSLSCNATLVIFSINGRHPKLWDFDKETKSSKRGRGGKGAAIEKMIVNGSNVGTLYPRAISYSGNFIAISSQTWGLRLCRVEDGCLIQDRLLPKESSDYVQFVKFSPDANRLVSSTKGRSFRLWDILRREQVGKDCVHESAITFINFGRDGAVVYSGTEDGSVHLWDAFTSDPITRLHQAHQGPVKSIDFGYNNPRLILSNSEGEALRWDVGEVAALAWRVSWSEEGPDRGWFKGKDGERMWYMPVENRGGQTLVLPEGYVITGSDAGRITILDCRTVFGRQSIMQETSV
jgi:WD40 repeat protein